jgi:hypothetical protein
MRTSTSSSKSSSTSKESKKEMLKEQQRIWLTGMNEEKHLLQQSVSSSAPSNIANSEVIIDNWSQMAASKANPLRIPSRAEKDDHVYKCRVCFETMQQPMLVVPCGHSFCQKVSSFSFDLIYFHFSVYLVLPPNVQRVLEIFNISF